MTAPREIIAGCRRRAAACAAALLLATPAWAGFVAPGPGLLADGIPPIPEAIAARVQAYSGFWPQRALSWNPERRELLISRRAKNVTQVFRLQAPGEAPQQMTRFSDPVARAGFPPRRSDYFVFAKDEGGNERYQLWRFDLAGGAATRLTDPRKRHGMPAWSRQDGRIAYTAVAVGAERDSREVRVEVRLMDPLDPASERLLAALPGPGWSVYDWSADGGTLALGEYVSATESYLWLLDVGSGTLQAVTPRGAEERAAHLGAAFSPDGRTVYTLSDRGSDFRRLVAIDRETRDARVVSADHRWNVDDFALAEDGSRIAFVTNEDGTSRLHVVETSTGRAAQVPTLSKGVISGLAWNRAGSELLFTFSSAQEPAGAYTLELGASRFVRWTIPETAGADPAAFVEPELVRWPSFDGRTIAGYLVRPPERFAGPRPVMIEIHGGPESQARPAFRGRYNYLVNELGIALLLPNVRGSSGYGKRFLALDDGLRREDAVRDIGAALDWIAADARLDARRVLVSGASYGGYMSLATATLYPERIACAISNVGISNFVSFLTNTESYRRDLRRAEYGDERDPAMRAFLESISPLNRAERIVRPLLVIQGANDPRVPRSEAEQIVRTVRRHGTPVWYLLGMDEGHGFARKSNVDFAFYTTVLFAEQCLGVRG